jgi:hypothetical protein
VEHELSRGDARRDQREVDDPAERPELSRGPGLQPAGGAPAVRPGKDHGPSVKNDEQYEGLRMKGMSKSRAAAIANSPGSSSRGGKSSGSSRSSRSGGSGSGGNRAQKAAAGRKGGKKSS